MPLPDNADLLKDDYGELAPEQLPVYTTHLDEADALSINKKLLAEADFQKFIQLWCDAHEQTMDSRSLVELLGGYHCQEVARLCEKELAAHELLLRSANHYSKFLQDQRCDPEIRYFAQWQMGLVMERLGSPWAEVEKWLLSASKYHEGRGEAMRYVIQHYRATSGWSFGFIYSSIAIKKFHGALPGQCQWFVNPGFYNWKVMYYHANICSKLLMKAESANSYRKIWPYVEQHPDEFTENQIQFFKQFKN
ncbi:hypothetical protein [Chitinophaga sp. S165]|uniref:hypothetical protein n=1 Tax=Chitinophaga sp. S165 TaxID=2135462 RepID=UPI000D7179E6|nr:hypothetical protein [Chitinophaga sp. S165]PWV47083.1 hypothetical protein C7475_109171 [Chitinophaga sp. S165]